MLCQPLNLNIGVKNVVKKIIGVKILLVLSKSDQRNKAMRVNEE
jgi:hypothetical protein